MSRLPGITFPFFSIQLGIHVRTDHGNDAQRICPKCNKTLIRYSQLLIHMKKVHQTGRFKCGKDKCRFVGKTRQEVFNHQMVTHAPKKLACQFPGCNYIGKSNSEMIRHERFHLRVKPYRCTWTDCGFQSAVRSSMVSHIRTMHFKLPEYMAAQIRRGIVDPRDPADYIQVDQELLARRLQ